MENQERLATGSLPPTMNVIYDAVIEAPPYNKKFYANRRTNNFSYKQENV
jgi:hypothetical protein